MAVTRLNTISLLFTLFFSAGILRAEEVTAKPRLYLVPYSHLDTQWLWPYEDSIEKHLKSTMDDNFKLFEKYPEHQFNFTGAYRYKLMKTYWPARFERLKSYVAQGRWHVAGSSFEENDVLIPDPESIQRQIFYGNKFFYEEFGKTSVDYLLPDSFGFPSSLPTIIQHAGLLGFSSQKLTWGAARGLPFNIGLWEGADGSKVLSALNPGAYDSSVPKDFDHGEWYDRLTKSPKLGLSSADYRYFGVGDVGGAPREDDVKNLVEVLRKPNLNFDIIYGASDQFFRDFESADKKDLPVVRGEMLLTEHSAGILTSNSRIKNENRKTERMAKQAEFLASFAAFIDGTIYPKAKLRKAWETLLPVQMHDIITGTAIPKALSHSMNDLAIAQNLFRGVIDHSAGLIAQKLDMSEKGYAVAVFNTLSQERSDLAQITLPKSQGTYDQVLSPEGIALPLQVIPNRKKSDDLASTYIFPVQLGPMEASLYTLILANPASAPVSGLAVMPASRKGIESDLYKLTVGKSGDITSIISKASGREELASPIRYQFTGEFPQKYPAWNMTWKDRKRPPRAYLEGKARISVLYEGHWQSAIRVEREGQGSTFVQTIRLTRGNPLIQVEEKIHWRTRNSALKVALHPRIKTKSASYDMGLAVEDRRNNSPLLFEMPQKDWLSMSDGKNALSIVNSCCYGSDKPSDDVIRLTLLYTPHSNSMEFRYNDSQDFGDHILNWAFMPHSGDWHSAQIVKQGDQFNENLLFYHPEIDSETGKTKSMGKRYSFLSAENAIIKAVKQEENRSDNSRILVRLYERQGQTTKFKLKLPAQALAIQELDGQERPIGPMIPGTGNTFEAEIPGYGIKTYALKLKSQTPNRLAPSTFVRLPFNSKSFSNTDRTLRGTLLGGKLSFPVDEYPKTLKDSGVEFDLSAARSGYPDTMGAAGQSLVLPSDAKGQIHILAFGTKDHSAKVTLDGKAFDISIPRFHGAIADGDRRYLNAENELERIRPAFLRTTPIAAFANYSHGVVGRLSYYPNYLFHCVLPPGKTLEIPPDPDFFIVAISVSTAAPSVTPLDEIDHSCGVRP